MKKLMSFLAVAIVGIAFMPNVYAETVITAYGEVNDITQEGEHFDDSSYSATTSGSNQEFVLTVDAGKLKVIDKAKDGVPNRNADDATWIGVSIDAPTGDDNKACFIRHGETTCNSFSKDYDSNQKYSLWIPFKASELEEALKNQGANAVVSKTYTIHWDGDSNSKNNIQTITVKVKANAVTLETDADSGSVETTATLTAEKKATAIAAYEAAQKAKENELDDVPNTGNTLPIALMGLVALVTGTGIYTLKTAYSRK